MLGGRPMQDWIEDYKQSHRNKWNQLTHSIGIPMILVSIGLGVLALFISGLWPWALALFVLGWVLQFLGHAIEGKPPEFFRDWRFLFVGTRWWWAKVTGKI